MPIYLVSWSDGACMLVRCRDEDDLIRRLDQFGHPARATWKRYRGPFIVSLRPEINRTEEVPFVTYAAELAGEETQDVSDAMTQFAFPATFRAEAEAWSSDEDVGLELLLEAEIVCKGFSEQNARRTEEWVRTTFAEQLERLPEQERKKRIAWLLAVMGWKRSD